MPLTAEGVVLGAIVVAEEAIGGVVPAGTIGVIDAIYDHRDLTGPRFVSPTFCVAWHLKEKPLPKGYRRFRDEFSLGGPTPFRTAFTANAEDLKMLRAK